MAESILISAVYRWELKSEGCKSVRVKDRMNEYMRSCWIQTRGILNNYELLNTSWLDIAMHLEEAKGRDTNSDASWYISREGL